MDFSALLGVKPGAPAAEVNSAFRKKSLLYHPDRCPNDPSAAERFRQLTAARDFLLKVARQPEASPAATVATVAAAAPAPRSPPCPAWQVRKEGGFLRWCTACGIQFPTKQSLTMHYRDQHDVRLSPIGVRFVKDASCPICNKKFKLHLLARDHVDYGSPRCRELCREKADRGELPELSFETMRTLIEQDKDERRRIRKEQPRGLSHLKEQKLKAVKRGREKERRKEQARKEKARRKKEMEKRRREQAKTQQRLKLKRQREKEKRSKDSEKKKKRRESGSAKKASGKKPKQEVEKVVDEEDEAEELKKDDEKEDEAETVDGDEETDEEEAEEDAEEEDEEEEEEEEEEEADVEGEEGAEEVAEVAKEVVANGLDERGERVVWQVEDEEAEDESIEDPEEIEEPVEVEADDDEVRVPEEVEDEEREGGAPLAPCESALEEASAPGRPKACAEQSLEAEDNAGTPPSSPRSSPRPKWRSLNRPAGLTAKQRRHGSLSERLAKVLESESCGPLEVNIGARGMLASMVRKLGSHAFEATSSSSSFRWHRHEARVLGMVEETLTTVRAAASRAAASAASRAEAAAADVETAERLADAVASAQMEVVSREVEVGRARELLARYDKSLVAAKAAEKEAAAEIRSAAQRESVCSQERRRAADAFSMFTKLEAAGGVQKKNPAAVDRMIKEIGRELEAAKLSETLASGHRRLVLPALRMEPGRRSRDSQAALSCAEGCLKDHLQELSEKLTEVSREWARAKDAERRARSGVAASTDRKHEAIDALQTANDELRDCGMALDGARMAQRQHETDLKHLSKEARMRKAELAEVDVVLSALAPVTISIPRGSC